MKKLPVFLAVLVFLLISSAYAIKNDIHKMVLGENSSIVHLIERSLGHNPPLFDKNIVGKTAPDFSLDKLYGGKINLADYRGKLVVLNFWASWCPPCRAEIPAFVEIQEKYKDKGVSFLGIAIEDKDDVDRYLSNEISINYPTSYGVEQAYKVSALYGNPDGALPYTLFINTNQKIVESHNGQMSKELLEDLIKKYLPK